MVESLRGFSGSCQYCRGYGSVSQVGQAHWLWKRCLQCPCRGTVRMFRRTYKLDVW